MAIRTRTSSLHMSVMVELETGEVITFMIVPGGRLTLSTGVPVMTATVSGATTIYYTPYIGQYIPLWDGTRFSMENFGGELSQLTTDATKSPAAVGANSNYDLFVWNDGGTIRCTRGPSWSSDTARGAGAGTTEITMLQGIYVNANAITNGAVANKGTYVGTVRSNAASQIDWIFGAAASGGTAGAFGVWNCYNRVVIATNVTDNGATYTYTTADIRQARASSGNQVSYIRGLNEDAVHAAYSTRAATVGSVAGATAVWGLGWDSTTVLAALSQVWKTEAGATGAVGGITSAQSIYPGLGYHFVAALEVGDGSNANTFNFGQLGVLSVMMLQ